MDFSILFHEKWNRKANIFDITLFQLPCCIRRKKENLSFLHPTFLYLQQDINFKHLTLKMKVKKNMDDLLKFNGLAFVKFSRTWMIWLMFDIIMSLVKVSRTCMIWLMFDRLMSLVKVLKDMNDFTVWQSVTYQGLKGIDDLTVL